jgi:hypothetical protein
MRDLGGIHVIGSDALGTAFDRIEDFIGVQTAEGFPITHGAVVLLQGAVGLDRSSRSTICERLSALEDVGVAAPRAAVLLGILIGLLAVQA